MPVTKPIRGAKINQTHPLAKGLVGCWLLNEGTGNKISDLSGHGKTGTLHGSPVWSAGKSGSCLKFANGNSQYVNLGNSYFGLNLTNRLSIVTLARRTSNDPYYAPIIQRSPYAHPFGFKLYRQDSYTRIIFSVRTTSGSINAYSATNDIPLGQWAQFAGTYDGSMQSVYHNGRLSNTIANSGNLVFTSSSYLTYLGAVEDYESSYNLDGAISYVFLWNISLTAAQIAWLSREPFAMFETSIAPVLASVRTSTVSITGSVTAQTNLSGSLEFIQKLNGTITATSSSSGLIQLFQYKPATELVWLSDTLFNGMTSNAFKLGTTLTLSWFWFRTTGCSALYRGPCTDKIDIKNILTVVGPQAVDISPPFYSTHSIGSTYIYIARRFNHIGYQEQTLKAAVKVTFDQNGDLTRPQPNKIFSIKAAQISPNKILLIWFYSPIEQKSRPVQFNIYSDNGTGQIDYENPIGIIEYQGRKFYSFLYEAPESGRYLFAIRAEDTESTENNSQAQLRVQVSDINLNPIEILNTTGV